MPNTPDLTGIFNKTPEEIVEQFRAKGNTISWNWREVWQEAHAKSFTVAKAMNMDVLDSIRTEVDSALAEGTTFRDFQKNLEPRLEEMGWWGRKEVVDPETGEVKEVQLGSPHRLKTIYRTNLSTSYSAGRYRTQQAATDRRPWWIYRDAGDTNVRPSHERMSGTVLRHDHPFWEKNYPPNGWGCRCGVDSLSDRQLEDRGLTPTEGRLEDIADPEWAYNPAKAAWQPDTDAVRSQFARKYVEAALQGQGLGYMYSRTQRTLDDLRAKGLTEEQIRNEIRGAMVREEFPVGVLDSELRSAINAEGHSVFLSAETLAKNMINHPELTLRDYRMLQEVYDNAQLVVKDSDNSLGFYYRNDETGELYNAVKATQTGDKMYVLSYRKASGQSLDNIRNRGEVLRDELEEE